MGVLRFFLAFMACVMAFSGCTVDDDKSGQGSLVLSSGSTVTLYSVVNQSETVSFMAGAAWTASCSADWLTFAPSKGKAGNAEITLTTTTTNRTRSPRTATLTIACGTAKETVTVRQRAEYAVFDAEKYTFDASGGEVTPGYSTNIADDELQLYASAQMDEWIEVVGAAARTRPDFRGSLRTLHILPNPTKNAREGLFFLAMQDADGGILPLDTLHIYQQGMSSGYVSSDYSADGRVDTLFSHSDGKGIPVVIMGDGFTDADIADSTYHRVMVGTAEALFSEQPISSLRQYFDVYAVTAVSANDLFGDGYSTALGCLPDATTTGIDVDEDKVWAYVSRIDSVDRTNMLVVVIVNSSLHKGVTYLYDDQWHQPVGTSIALNSLHDGVDTELFRQVLVHEAIGHGFGKLGDEYVNSLNGSASDSDIAAVRYMHGYDWYMNVDVEADSAKVLWCPIIFDKAFSGEGIGVFEGGFTFYKRIYRPSEESMMNHNNSPFNAPSRQAIYNRVMKLATGTKPTLAQFAAFDAAHKPERWSYESAMTRSPWLPAVAPCVRLRRMIRDVCP